MVSATQARLCIVLAALLWSTCGAFTKILRENTGLGFNEPNIDPLSIAFWRVVFAASVLLPMVRRRELTFRPALWLTGLAFALMNALFISATAWGPSANAILLEYTAPMWVYVISVGVLGEPAQRRGLATLLLGMAGIGVLFAGAWRRDTGNQLPAVALALCSGLAYAGVILGLRAQRNASPRWVTSFNFLFGAAVLLPIVWRHPLPSWPQFAVLFVFGAVRLALSYWQLAAGLRRLSAQEVGTLSTRARRAASLTGEGIRMTEIEWLNCEDPHEMLIAMQATPRGETMRLFMYNKRDTIPIPMVRKPSNRKLRLFACARARRVWFSMAEQCSRDAVLAAERFADGLVDRRALADACRAIRADFRNKQRREIMERTWIETSDRDQAQARAVEWAGAWDTARATVCADARAAACDTANTATITIACVWNKQTTREKEAAKQASILRDVFGIPFAKSLSNLPGSPGTIIPSQDLLRRFTINAPATVYLAISCGKSANCYNGYFEMRVGHKRGQHDLRRYELRLR